MLTDMPTHLDILCGDYRRAVVSNSDAIRADERFARRSGVMNLCVIGIHFQLLRLRVAFQGLNIADLNLYS